jgi:cytochrome c5
VRPSFAVRMTFIILFVGAYAVGAQNASSPQRLPKLKSSVAQATTNESAEGEKRFELQCGRCHQAPEDLSPRTAKAVVRQMRVRANLSPEDERVILKYLAP